MIDAPPLVLEGLGKRFGAVQAVEDLSFTVAPGRVTGFLGPNGSGKTTTLRMLLGLTRPTTGRALVGDSAYADLAVPGAVVGAALEPGFHPGRTALGHLEAYAPQVGAHRARCREVLVMVGLDESADRRVGGFSLGMRQRLGLATALLADPPVLVLDEPANGLDPEGIKWLRGLLRHFAAEGRTVLVSSHVLGEVQHTVDDVVVIAHGRLVHASTLEGLAELAEARTYVESADPEGLAAALASAGWDAEPSGPQGRGLVVSGVPAAQVGALAHAAGLELHQLTSQGTDLEDVFFHLVEQAGTRQEVVA
ncbi:putative ABC transporter ATP-binding protein YxlF [Nocardioides dokdonensis FR1436]|uniref:Putative ABC transporter ATP-binding protein YxlF n=1 Tax=Nocardioides dokdonensis FR1436 TaxID=1300347 RepID=A0A1A9GL30_9ACTN|nr:ATP-binding cassette domain-containing protein [Nocardioides dokdonensis]ANH38390.1 putative ABC transporter ATP-binding protein YxlF [Nocardioides dokdonensis FR1436]